jgi:hypothetical protein
VALPPRSGSATAADTNLGEVVDDYDRTRGLMEEQLAALGKNIAIVQIRIDA